MAIAGYLLAPSVAGFILHATGAASKISPDDQQLIAIVAAASWVGLVALYTRYFIGGGKESPGGMWSCPACKYLNQPYAVICEACRQPYSSKA